MSVEISEIVSLLESGDYVIEIFVDDLVKDDVVLAGAIYPKNNKTGLNRQEFAFRKESDKETLMNQLSKVFTQF
ncbi:hypothetical protein [Sediminibacillus sp. JSM 1682029]|uniref:hypothetical protein n=1 Tax=Sediminibacillus sp. JSM 1682029 TaxID=3229857 RepID=UPI0035262D69